MNIFFDIWSILVSFFQIYKRVNYLGHIFSFLISSYFHNEIGLGGMVIFYFSLVVCFYYLEEICIELLGSSAPEDSIMRKSCEDLAREMGEN